MTVSVDRALRLVADPQRRQALASLSDSDGAVPVAELVEEIDDGGADRQQLLVRLRHSHLPKLDEAGVVRYDRENDAVTYLGDDTVESLLAWLERIE